MTDERLSIVDIFKIGVGPSSSHTLGPWRAAQQCLARWTTSPGLAGLQALDVHLFGSLAKTGRGHGTDVAIVAGLLDADPEVCDMVDVHARVERVLVAEAITLPPGNRVELHVQFHPHESLPAHPNGLRFDGTWSDGRRIAITCFSIGGGFVAWEDGEGPARASPSLSIGQRSCCAGARKRSCRSPTSCSPTKRRGAPKPRHARSSRACGR
jgi:L-serine dehydratase